MFTGEVLSDVEGDDDGVDEFDSSPDKCLSEYRLRNGIFRPDKRNVAKIGLVAEIRLSRPMLLPTGWYVLKTVSKDGVNQNRFCRRTVSGVRRLFKGSRRGCFWKKQSPSKQSP